MGRNLPLVSVVIPTLNRTDSVIAAVDSVRAQTYPFWEILLIDDGSTEANRRAVETLAGSRLRYLWQSNAGQGAARNQGIGLARGELIAFLDSDDLWEPDKLELQVALLRSAPEVGLVFADAIIVQDGAVCFRHFERVPPIRGDVRHPLLVRNFLVTSSVVARRRLIKQAGGFDPRPVFRNAEDYDLWLRLSRLTRFDFVDAPLVRYHQHAGNSSRNSRMTLRSHLAVYAKAAGATDITMRLRLFAGVRWAQEGARLLRAMVRG